MEQLAFIQDGIGCFGVIRKVFDGVVHFLMQAKAEPGNSNEVQISATIQATRNNTMQLYSGWRPADLGYSLNSDRRQLLVNQIRSQ